MVHHGLECSWGVSESKEHHCRFKYAIWGFECSLPLVTLLDSDVVVSLSDIKFGEDECMDQISNGLFDIQ